MIISPILRHTPFRLVDSSYCVKTTLDCTSAHGLCGRGGIDGDSGCEVDRKGVEEVARACIITVRNAK